MALKSAAHAALDVERVRRSVSLTIVVTGDAALRKLNRAFLGIDAPTDVLSFAAYETGVEPPSGEPAAPGGPPRPAWGHGHGQASTPIFLGDVIISLARAKAQAKIGGHALIDELRLLVIHGVLHLLGHDHAAPEEKRRMWSAQAKALKRTGALIEEPAS